MEKITVEKLKHFFSQYPTKFIKSGTIFISQKENPPGILFLQSGTVRQFLQTNDHEVTTTIFKPYSFFPLPWALGITKTNYSYSALTDIRISVAPAESVISFLQSNTDVLFELMCRVLSGLDAVTTRMTYLMSGSAYQRVVLELLFLAKRFGERESGEQTISFTIIQSELGNQTGLTRETVNREINKLKKMNILMFHKNIVTIPSLAKLEEELGKRDFS